MTASKGFRLPSGLTSLPRLTNDAGTPGLVLFERNGLVLDGAADLLDSWLSRPPLDLANGFPWRRVLDKVLGECTLHAGGKAGDGGGGGGGGWLPPLLRTSVLVAILVVDGSKRSTEAMAAMAAARAELKELAPHVIAVYTGDAPRGDKDAPGSSDAPAPGGGYAAFAAEAAGHGWLVLSEASARAEGRWLLRELGVPTCPGVALLTDELLLLNPQYAALGLDPSPGRSDQIGSASSCSASAVRICHSRARAPHARTARSTTSSCSRKPSRGSRTSPTPLRRTARAS